MAKIRKSFTLIEIILVMVLLAIITGILLTNFNSSLKKGRDAQRKNDLAQIQKALELYYADTMSYPTFTTIFGAKICSTVSCATSDRVYMQRSPDDPNSSYHYVYVPEASATPSYYYLYSYIENDQDAGTNISQTGFSNNVECATGILCKYYTSSTNAPPLTPKP
jgi:type II secretory pathway pseudopilin PulG